MTVTFQLPAELEAKLRPDIDVGSAAKEAFLVSLYREGTLSHAALTRALGLDRFATEEVLKKHHVTEDMGTTDDVLAEVAAIEKLRAARG